MEALLPGQRIGAYRILRQLGVGGMGQVYEAEHVALGVKRALKVFSTVSEHSEFLRKRFVAEGRILADLQHPRIVRVYDLVVDEDSGMAYFEMDLVLSPNGQPRTLADEQREGVGEERIAGWFKDICEGLAYIHSQGVVHRDISLDNILIGPDGHAVITDFGIAKIIDDSYRKKIDVTVTMVYKDGSEMRMGKGLYMAPELKKPDGRASFASDAWAVGVLLFRMLSGSWYDVGTHLEDWLADFEYDWHPVISRLCNVDPEKRLGEGGIAALPLLLKRKVRPVPFWRRKWVMACWIVAALVVAAVAFGSAYLEECIKYKEVLEYEFTTNKNDGKRSVTITRVKKAKGDFKIPAEIDGWPVTCIAEGAFEHSPELTSVTISASVTNICEGAFWGCRSLNSFSVAKGNPRYKSVSSLLLTKDGKTIVAVPNSLKDVTIPEGVTDIGDRTFGSVPHGILGISNELTNVTISASVTNIMDKAFVRCRKLESFSVAGGNPNYISSFGLLLTKDGTTIVAAPSSLKNVIIPAGVTRVREGTFSHCQGLTDVTILAGVTTVTIDDRAFEFCHRIKSVTIPDNVTCIGAEAFYESVLKTVYVSMGDADRVKKMFLKARYDIKDIRFREVNLHNAEFFDRLCKAAERGNANAQSALGYCYARGHGVEKDTAEAVKWFRKAAEQGDKSAQYELGQCYGNGVGVAEDKAEAIKWYRKAAEQGDSYAQYSLGLIYAEGKGVAKDMEEAAKWYRKAAEQGNANAQNNLGNLYAKGYGVAKDMEEAAKWYRKAAEQGNANAQNALGYCYARGHGVEKDTTEAVKWFRKAAEQGNAIAQCELGCFCTYTNLRDNSGETESVKWWLRAAEQGNATAQINLGYYYRNNGVAGEAVKWFHKAAELGDSNAQYELGQCYGNGVGVAEDKAEAIKWYRKAAGQEHAKAQDALKRLGQHP